jgi:hypothetical protein
LYADEQLSPQEKSTHEKLLDARVGYNQINSWIEMAA